jgi:rod shape determining protein RodA
LTVAAFGSDFDHGRPTLAAKLKRINWPLVMLVAMCAGVGAAMLYSAADARLDPWASRQLLRFGVALAVALAVALVDLRRWLGAAYWIYAAALLLIIAVDLRGAHGMGARRWIDLGLIQLQPSELMSLALTLALARYFHGLANEDVERPLHLVPPALMILLPAALVLKEPDLGTALMLLMGGAVLFFVAGVPLRLFALGVAAAGAVVPLAWHFLRDYQKNRIYTFLDPSSDPQGAGYHILQSKIALGSGGLFGKGFLLGTQSHLSFLPEKHTDFIFTMLAEEFGFVGGVGLLLLYTLIIVIGFGIALRCRSHFGRLLGLGIATNFFLYVFINMAMVMGLIPVVGVPLPLISYGGTAMLTVMLGFGLLLNLCVHRDLRINRHGDSQPG